MQLTLLIAPAGAGKSSFVRRALVEQRNLVHISRDNLAKKLIRQSGVNPNLTQTREQIEASNTLLGESLDKEYFENFLRMLTVGDRNIIIDYVPGTSMTWAEETIRLAKTAGFHVRLDGIYANPKQTWQRSIERNCRGVDLSSDFPQILEPNGPYFKAWLKTYKIFPAVFSRLASPFVDEIFLWSNNLLFELLAVWHSEGSHWKSEVYNQKVYSDFRNLTNIQLDKAVFSAICIKSEKTNGIWNHVFDVSVQC